MAGPSDIALISLATTMGLRRSDAALAALFREAGVSCQVVPVRIGAAGRLRRHPAITDLVEALAARRSLRRADGRVLVFSTVTAALLASPRAPYAVRFDAPAALNRPGVGGAWQRARERRMLARAALLLPYGESAAAAAGRALGSAGGGPSATVPLHSPIEAVESSVARDLDAVAYAGNPRKRGLDLMCAAWAEVGPPGGRLVIGGVDRGVGLRWLERCHIPEPPGVEWAGAVPRSRWLEIVARARVLVNASRWEDYGLAQLEALSAGTPLATVPSPGSYEALPLARALAPALVADGVSAPSLARALRAALLLDESERVDYAHRAADLLAPFRPAAVRLVIADRVLPALGLGRT